ncbi:MAG: glycosyltransferase, partial [Verrucomicrobiae bacterium]|nr:glycosyltransferase [Verrucomicrobiae bacterium]
KAIIPQLFDKKRLEHLSHADLVTMVTPQGTQILKSIARRFGHSRVAERTHYLPHPQLPLFTYDGREKENIVVSVGRWSKDAWFQKNPKLLLQSLAGFMEVRTDYRSVIVGSSVELLQPLIEELCGHLRNRFELIPFLSPEELRDVYLKSKIGFWTSRHEGQQGTGSQALCCGCSTVSTNGVSMNCFAHYADRSSGRQAIQNDSSFLTDALVMEAHAWDAGHRDPHEISRNWTAEFHHVNVARRLLKLASADRSRTP